GHPRGGQQIIGRRDRHRGPCGRPESLPDQRGRRLAGGPGADAGRGLIPYGMKTQVEAAAERLKGIVSHTPLQYSPRLSERYQASVYLKREDLQVVRSYKLRGAFHKMSRLSAAQRQNGVV